MDITPTLPDTPNDTKSILVGICTYRDVAGKTMGAIWKACSALGQYHWGLSLSDTVNIPQSRNYVCKSFLESEADYLFFIDQDMLFEPHDVKLLIESLEATPDAGAVSGFYIKRDGSCTPLCVWTDPENDREIISGRKQIELLIRHRGELVEADLIPTGFMLIRREALEDLPEPYFHLHWEGKDMWSSDSEFCFKLKKAGWKTYCHLGIEVGHLGTFTWEPKHFYQKSQHYLNQAVRDEVKEKALAEYGANTQEYWDAVWDVENELGFVRDYRKVWQQIVPNVPEDSRVLDIGCGPGMLLEALRELRDIRPSSCGLDISKKAVDITRSKGFRAYEWDATQDELHEAHTGQYDVVISTEVVEHLEDEDRLLRAAWEALKPGGIFILSCPANCMGPSEEPEHVRVIPEEEIGKWFRNYDNYELFRVMHYWVGFGRKPLAV